jgi:hypothetical protein
VKTKKKSVFQIQNEIARLKRRFNHAKTAMETCSKDGDDFKMTMFSHTCMELRGAVEALEWVLGERYTIMENVVLK